MATRIELGPGAAELELDRVGETPARRSALSLAIRPAEPAMPADLPRLLARAEALGTP